MVNDVKVLKLITGEEVMARIERDGDTLILDTPMVLQVVGQVREGHLEMNIIPWIFSGTSKKVKLSSSYVMFVDDIKEQHGQKYLETVTGLTLPSEPKKQKQLGPKDFANQKIGQPFTGPDFI